jgi:hypothetical protein
MSFHELIYVCLFLTWQPANIALGLVRFGMATSRAYSIHKTHHSKGKKIQETPGAMHKKPMSSMPKASRGTLLTNHVSRVAISCSPPFMLNLAVLPTMF